MSATDTSKEAEATPAQGDGWRRLVAIVAALVVTALLAAFGSLIIGDLIEQSSQRITHESGLSMQAMAASIDAHLDAHAAALGTVAMAVRTGSGTDTLEEVTGLEAFRVLEGGRVLFEAANTQQAARRLSDADALGEARVGLLGDDAVVVRVHRDGLTALGLVSLPQLLGDQELFTELLAEEDPRVDRVLFASMQSRGGRWTAQVEREAGTLRVRALAMTRHGLLVQRTVSQPAENAHGAWMWLLIGAMAVLTLGGSVLLSSTGRSSRGPESTAKNPEMDVADSVDRLAQDVETAVQSSSVLTALEQRLAEMMPDAGWRVLSHEAVAPDDDSDVFGVSRETLETALRQIADSRQQDAAPSDPRDIGRSGQMVFVIRDAQTAYAVAVAGRHLSTEERRRAGLLFRVAALALRTISLLERLVVSEHQAAVGRLAAGVAHEVNNPLAFVLMNLRAVLPELSGDQHQAVEEAIEGADRIEQIIRGLRVLFHGPEELVFEKVDLEDLATKTARIARARHVGTPISVEGDGRVLVEGDQIGLGQIMLNLLTNAVDAVRGASSPEVKVRLRFEDGMAVVDVADNGPGVAEAIRPRLFEAFVTTKGKRGTGLGLGITRSFARAHGGDLLLLSTGPEGTVFRFTMPALDPAAASSSPPKGRPSQWSFLRQSSEFSVPRVLVVDDEAPLIRATKRWLRGAAEVVGTVDPEEGLELAKSETFDLILCDLNMPLLSGLDFVERLRVEAPAVAKKVVIMTGSIDAEIHGMPVITKPVSPETLEEVLMQTRNSAEHPSSAKVG